MYIHVHVPGQSYRPAELHVHVCTITPVVFLHHFLHCTQELTLSQRQQLRATVRRQSFMSGSQSENKLWAAPARKSSSFARRSPQTSTKKMSSLSIKRYRNSRRWQPITARAFHPRHPMAPPLLSATPPAKKWRQSVTELTANAVTPLPGKRERRWERASVS